VKKTELTHEEVAHRLVTAALDFAYAVTFCSILIGAASAGALVLLMNPHYHRESASEFSNWWI
jgi:hypothetical protein